MDFFEKLELQCFDVKNIQKILALFLKEAGILLIKKLAIGKI